MEIVVAWVDWLVGDVEVVASVDVEVVALVDVEVELLIKKCSI